MYYDEALALAKDVNAAVLLMKASYYSSIVKKDRNGWFYKTTREFCKETGLSRRALEKARQKLISLKYIEHKVCGLPARSWYKVSETILNQTHKNQNRQNEKLIQLNEISERDKEWFDEVLKNLY